MSVIQGTHFNRKQHAGFRDNQVMKPSYIVPHCNALSNKYVIEIVYQMCPWKSWGPIFGHSVKRKPHKEPYPYLLNYERQTSKNTEFDFMG
jgi:hypothetical protein